MLVDGDESLYGATIQQVSYLKVSGDGAMNTANIMSDLRGSSFYVEISGT